MAWLHRRLIGQVTENIWGTYGALPDAPTESARGIVSVWMNGPPHRKNILELAVTHSGVCARRLGPIIWFTHVFAHVRAYLDDILPRYPDPGQPFSVTATPISAPGEKAKKYGFWNPRTDQFAAGPFPLDDQPRIPDPDGKYGLRLYFPDGEGQWYRGPNVKISSRRGPTGLFPGVTQPDAPYSAGMLSFVGDVVRCPVRGSR